MSSHNWPFPSPGGPIPWTPKQIKDYARKQREEMDDAPF